MSDTQTIVIAWACERLLPTGRKLTPSACTWVLKGSDEDRDRAARYACTLTDTVGAKVYAFPTTHPDPLGEAKARIVLDLQGDTDGPVAGRPVVSWDGRTERRGVITDRGADGRWVVWFDDGWVDSYRSFSGVVIVQGHATIGLGAIGCYLVGEHP